MQAAGLELITIKAQPEQPAAHAVLFIVCHAAATTGFLLYQRLMADCQTELQVRLDLPGMEGGVEQPELNGALGKGSVEVEPPVAALVVMV